MWRFVTVCDGPITFVTVWGHRSTTVMIVKSSRNLEVKYKEVNSKVTEHGGVKVRIWVHKIIKSRLARDPQIILELLYCGCKKSLFIQELGQRPLDEARRGCRCWALLLKLMVLSSESYRNRTWYPWASSWAHHRQELLSPWVAQAQDAHLPKWGELVSTWCAAHL